MEKTLAAMGITLALTVASANAAYVAQWDTSGLKGNESFIQGIGSSHVTADNLFRGSGLTATLKTDYFSSGGWAGNDPSDYVQLGFSVATGYQTTLTKLLIQTKTQGVGTIGVFTSLDNFVMPVYTMQPTTSTTNRQISLGNMGPVTGSFAIRFMQIGDLAENGNPTYSNGVFQIGDSYLNGSYSNIILTGSTEPVPATPTPIPAAGWLLGSGLMGLMGIRKRK